MTAGLATAATTAVAVTAWPASPTDISKSLAMGVRMLIGSSSLQTSANMVIAMDSTAGQLASCWSSVVEE